MSAALQLPLVLVKAIERPSLDHSNYHSFARWTTDNIDKLETWFEAQQQADGELTDFERWCHVQHDICAGEAARWRANERYNRGCSV